MKESNIGGVLEKPLQVIAQNGAGHDVVAGSLRRDQYPAIEIRRTVLLISENSSHAPGVVCAPSERPESVLVNADAKSTPHK
jgi:hypothetical protein